MAKPELGTKRQCGGCSAKFYDLNRDPILCPKCETLFEPVVVATRSARAPAPVAPVPKKAEVVEETVEATPDNVEVVSLEDVESTDEEIPEIEDVVLVDDDDDEDLESDESDTFIEDDDDGDPNVSDILGTDIPSTKEES